MSLFKPATKISTRADAVAKFKSQLDSVIADAVASGADRRQLADVIDGRSEGLRVQDSISRPIGY